MRPCPAARPAGGGTADGGAADGGAADGGAADGGAAVRKEGFRWSRGGRPPERGKEGGTKRGKGCLPGVIPRVTPGRRSRALSILARSQSTQE
ncbi:hypothetical protein Slala05_31350 [Streptomyces lavendulae subsp. lavendulae]|nr:hypothetical protein Slala05_31350 [Streptomyces lavendulae subsp. lavendulae]